MRCARLATVFGCAAVVALSQACTSEAAAVTRASSHARHHLPAFAAFERWAHRVVAGDGAARADAALSELLFAPARNAPDLVAAFVEIDGRRERAFALPARVALGAVHEWVPLRDPTLGVIHAAVEPRCPIDGSAAVMRGLSDAPCVLMTNRLAKADQPIAITMAFRAARLD